jgi:hypothetical protein
MCRWASRDGAARGRSPPDSGAGCRHGLRARATGGHGRPAGSGGRRARAWPAGPGVACGPGRAAGFGVRCALRGLGPQTRDLGVDSPGLEWQEFADSTVMRGRVWHAGMSVGGANLRLRLETGRRILVRRARTPAIRSKGEAHDERFSCSRAWQPGAPSCQAIRQAAVRVARRGGRERRREQGLGDRLLNETGLRGGQGRWPADGRSRAGSGAARRGERGRRGTPRGRVRPSA